MRIERKNSGKVRRPVWIDPYLVMLLQADGLDLSSFLDRALAVYFEVPEDPRESLIREKMEAVKLRLRSSYETEMREIIRTHKDLVESEDTEKSKENLKLSELKTLGESLKTLKFYSSLKKCLEDPDLVDDHWRSWEYAATVLSSINGKNYDADQLWNISLQWWQKYGKVKA